MKPRPKTKPTGAPPPGAKRGGPPPDATKIPPETVRAWRVKATYVQERTRWEFLKTGVAAYTPAKSYDGLAPTRMADDATVEINKARSSVWQSLLDWCDARAIPAEEYIRYCFERLPPTKKNPPEPDNLKNAAHEAAWRDGADDRETCLRLELKSQVETARCELTIHRTVFGDDVKTSRMCVLGSATLGLSPLFRYCMAMRIGSKSCLGLADRLFGLAVIQFETNRALYLKVWADWLPPEFDEESRQVYPYLLSKFWVSRRTDDKTEE